MQVEIDDEMLAILIDGGIDAVPLESRAMILRAIGSQPDIAAVVASLAEIPINTSAVIATAGPFGFSRMAWIRSWAACAMLAVVMTVWLIVAIAPPAETGVQLLGSETVMSSEQSPGK